MADFLIIVRLPDALDNRTRNILVLDAAHGWHAQVAAYMFVTGSRSVPADKTDISGATSGPVPAGCGEDRGPILVHDRVNARVYNPNPYRDYPTQNKKPDVTPPAQPKQDYAEVLQRLREADKPGDPVGGARWAERDREVGKPDDRVGPAPLRADPIVTIIRSHPLGPAMMQTVDEALAKIQNQQQSDQENVAYSLQIRPPRREVAHDEHGVTVNTVSETLEGLAHCVTYGAHEDAIGHLFALLKYLAPGLIIRDDEGKPAVVGLNDLFTRYGDHPACIKEPDDVRSD